MELYAISLVTIIAPKHMKNDFVKLFRSAEISGYTYFDALGGGEHHLRLLDENESKNLQFKILLPKIIAISLMQVVAERYFGKEKVVIFEQEANVIRHDKFDKVIHR